MRQNWQIIFLSHQGTYKPYTLVGPTVTRQVQEPLAVSNAQGGDLGCSVGLLELLNNLAQWMVQGESG